MLSVSESAQMLGVSPTRVRKLISDGQLPASKVGKSWLLREEDVMQRLSSHPKAGRPQNIQQTTTPRETTSDQNEDKDPSLHDLYVLCKESFRACPTPALLESAQSAEEAAFYVATTDFFLQQKQLELVKQGVF